MEGGGIFWTAPLRAAAAVPALLWSAKGGDGARQSVEQGLEVECERVLDKWESAVVWDESSPGGLGWVAGELPNCAVSLQVSELPFPFERHQQFEQSIQTPLGPTWNTQRAFQKLTAPRVITRAGHIIQPLSAEDVPTTATTAGNGAKPALEIVPKGQEQPLRHPRGRAR